MSTSHCTYKKVQTGVIYASDDDFNFPSTLPSNIANPIVFDIASWQVSRNIDVYMPRVVMGLGGVNGDFAKVIDSVLPQPVMLFIMFSLSCCSTLS